MNIICWFLGHSVTGKKVEKSSNNNADSEWRDCWQYFCGRCNDPNNFPLNQFPDRRNLWQRSSIRLWFSRRRNRKLFKQFEMTPERRRKQLEYYEAQLKKIENGGSF